jgi:hypothetical protein
MFQSDMETRLHAAHLVLSGLLQSAPSILTLPEYQQILVRRQAINLAHAAGLDPIPATENYILSIVELDDTIVEMTQDELKAMERAFVDASIKRAMERLGENGYKDF